MGSRAVVVVCRDADVAEPPLRRAGQRRRGHDRHPHRAAVLQRRGPRQALLDKVRDAPSRRRSLGGTGHRLAGARRRAPAVVGQGRGAPPPPVRIGRRRRDSHARERRRRCSGPRSTGAPMSASSCARTERAPLHGRPLRRRLPAVLLAGRRRSTTSAWRRSRFWRPREGPRPHRPPLAPRRPGTSRRCRPGHVPGHAPASSSTSMTLCSEAAATAWWEELTGRGGEGMVVKPVDVVAPRSARA